MREIRSEAPAALRQALSDQHSAPQKLAYSVREVAALTGLGRSTIYVLLGQKNSRPCASAAGG